MKRHQLSDSLRESFEAAQSQSASFDDPPPEWNRRASVRGHRVLAWGLALLALAALGVAALRDGKGDDAPASGSTTAPVAISLPPRVTPEPPSAALTAETPTAQPPSITEASGSVALNGTTIELSLSNTPLAEAARLLAEKTGSHVYGLDTLAALGFYANLRWQGSDVASAWTVLLSHLPNKSISCSGQSCEIWITGAGPSAPVTLSGSKAVPWQQSSPERARRGATQVGPGAEQQLPLGGVATPSLPPAAPANDTTDDGVPK
jgi:hypothetical protein